MYVNFYDIESLENVFSLVNFDEKKNHLDIWILCDEDFLETVPNWRMLMRDVIYQSNLNFNGTIRFYDLRDKNLELRQEGAYRLAATFGISNSVMINDKSHRSDYPDAFRLVCDTDPEYDSEVHPYLAGYNSYNYDTTMLALAFMESFQHFDQIGPDGGCYTKCEYNPTTASILRAHSDNMFSKTFKSNMPNYLVVDQKTNTKNYNSDVYRIRKNMMMSGRHLDVARLNEKQSRVALKRLLGMLGYQILESKQLRPGQNKIKNFKQLCDLIAYNCSDCINLRLLFYHDMYQAQFELKKGLLETYPELIYNKRPDAYKPDISPTQVRRDRLNIDSSSAQFATKCLCPYDHLTDIPAVSFLYPHKEKAKELGIKQVNVLDEARAFFYKLYPQQELRDKFDKIYCYYKSIEGKNFNDSKSYRNDYNISEYNMDPNYCHVLSDIPKTACCMPYYDKDGNPTTGFITFSTGGIHGAEYNAALYQADLEEYNTFMDDVTYVKSLYPDPVDLRKAKTVTMPDGRELKYTTFLRSGLKIDASEYKDFSKKQPILFKPNKKNDGGTELNTKYSYTSADKTNHEDFKSYYPNLLRMMLAFYNAGLGYDRYAEIFDQKESYGKLMKDKSLDASERSHYAILREGTKLILNSASGAADATFENNIRVNNQIISMRIIGQLFSWRIGQAQAYEGSKIISTNTDGLYSCMDDTLNNIILERESKEIGVEIEPEPMFLISKDTNNRLEIDLKTGVITSASGGTLGCRKGPRPDKSLSHPAIIDWGTSEYLVVAAQNYKGLSLSTPFDEAIGASILQKAATQAFDQRQFLLMMQHIVSSSPASNNYIYGVTDANPNEPIVMQHYNRMFIMKDETPNTVHLWAATAKVITVAMMKKRMRDNERQQRINPIAMHVLSENGITDIPTTRDVVSEKVTNISSDWYIYIQNKSLDELTPEETRFILDNLDYSKYLFLLKNCFENNWRNKMSNIISA